MVSVLVSNAVVRGFEFQSGQTKDCKIRDDEKLINSLYTIDLEWVSD
jgi:hypothetical protein